MFTPENTDAFLEGLAILGTGGGGAPSWGRHIMLHDFELGRKVEIVSPDDVPDDAIVASDIFYLVPPDMHARIIEDIAKALVDGGIFILKEMDRRPLWKYWINYLQETVMVKLSHFTLGNKFYFMHSKNYETIFKKNNLSFKETSAHRGYSYPHVYYIGKKIRL